MTGPAEAVALGRGLHGQLAGRGEDERDRAVPTLFGTYPETFLVVDVDYGREDEGERLSGTCLSDSDHVLPAEGQGPACVGVTLALDGGGLCELDFVEDSEDVVREVGLLE